MADTETGQKAFQEKRMTNNTNFSMTRRFALMALVSILLVGTASATLLSRYFGKHILHRDGELTMQFLQSLTDVQKVRQFLAGKEEAKSNSDVEQFFEHLAAMPDTLHANVYDPRRKVLWSTSPKMIGKTLPLNPELSTALQGKLVVESNLIGDERHYKAEHEYLPKEDHEFIEDYVPLFDTDRKTVIGVVELYRTPKALFETTHGLIRRVWISTLAGGLILFLSLFWLARRADRIIITQHNQLVESETMAAVGEMATTVAHSIRNPLASIRSSAELAQDLDGENQKGVLQDIIAEVDRMAAWVRNLLTYTQPAHGGTTPIDIREVVEASLSGYTRELEKHAIKVMKVFPEDLPRINGDHNLLVQVFNSLISNALEAMPRGGVITCSARTDNLNHMMSIELEDTGNGMTAEQLEKALLPFHTTKKFGLGVGLPMVKRLVERFGGTLKIASTPSAGTTVTITLPMSTT